MDKLGHIREKQRQDWNTFSPGWKKWDGFIMDFFRPIGEKLLEAVDLEIDFRVLDVATGTGEPGLTAAARVKNGEVIGTDISEEMVKIANENAKNRGIPNYRALACNTERQPFDDNYFDAVVCRFGIMYFPDMAEGTRELIRVLKPGRKISFSAWAGPEKNSWVTTMGGVINRTLQIPPPPSDVPGVFRCANSGTLTRLLRGAGLKEVKEIEISGNVMFDSPEQYWDFMMEIAPPIVKALSATDETTKDNIKREVLEAAKKYKGEKGISFTWGSWIGYGTK